VKKKGKQITDAESLDIQVVVKDFFETVVNNIKIDIPELVIKMSICEWGGDVSSSSTNAREVRYARNVKNST